MGKKWISMRIDENLLDAVTTLERNAANRSEAIENRLKKSLVL